MNEDKFAAMYNEAPIPGQSWTGPRRTMPFERPSEESSVEEYLNKLFRRMSSRQVALQFLTMVDRGVPLDHIVQTVVQSMFGEGKINANMVFLMIPPLTVMLWRMAEAAGLKPRLSTDGNDKAIPPEMLTLKNANVSSGKVDKAIKVLDKSSDVKTMSNKTGLMQRPESMI